MLLPNLPIIPTIFLFLKLDLRNFYGNDLPISFFLTYIEVCLFAFST